MFFPPRVCIYIYQIGSATSYSTKPRLQLLNSKRNQHLVRHVLPATQAPPPPWRDPPVGADRHLPRRVPTSTDPPWSPTMGRTSPKKRAQFAQSPESIVGTFGRMGQSLGEFVCKLGGLSCPCSRLCLDDSLGEPVQDLNPLPTSFRVVRFGVWFQLTIQV